MYLSPDSCGLEGTCHHKNIGTTIDDLFFRVHTSGLASHFSTALHSELLLGTRYMHAYSTSSTNQKRDDDDGPGVCSFKKSPQ